MTSVEAARCPPMKSSRAAITGREVSGDDVRRDRHDVGRPMPASARIAARCPHHLACSPMSGGHTAIRPDRHDPRRVQQPRRTVAQHSEGVGRRRGSDAGRATVRFSPSSVWRGASATRGLGWHDRRIIRRPGMRDGPPDRDVPTIDGVPLTPKAGLAHRAADVRHGRGGAAPPQAEAGRRAAHLRALRLRRGRRRPHHRARSRVPRPLLGQPVRPQLPPHAGQRPDPRQPRRRRRVRRPSR